MERPSRVWARRLAVALALVVGLLAAALPATAAPSTKNYSAALTFGSQTLVQSVSVPSGGTSNVKLFLTNRQDSQQSFGSAQVDFTVSAGAPLPSGVTVSRPGWTVQPLTPAPVTSYRILNSGTPNAVPPGGSLEVVIAMPGTSTGTTGVTTKVRQSNDFNGTKNDFTVDPTTATQQIVTTGVTTSPCAATCTPGFTSTVNGVVADLTVSSPSAFTFTAGFTTNRLSCDTVPFGPTVTPEPFQVDATSPSPVTKTLVLTFPKALANLVPNNGTPLHPVCAGGDAPFPGGSSAGARTHPFEGLLLNCSDPAYTAAVTAAGSAPFLPMCVQSRARNAGKLIVTISVQETTFDPRFW